MNVMKDLARFSIALQPEAPTGGEWPPKDVQFAQLHFEKSKIPGHIRVFQNGQWYEVPGLFLMNGIMTMCPFEGPPAPVIPTRPLNPVR